RGGSSCTQPRSSTEGAAGDGAGEPSRVQLIEGVGPPLDPRQVVARNRARIILRHGRLRANPAERLSNGPSRDGGELALEWILISSRPKAFLLALWAVWQRKQC